LQRHITLLRATQSHSIGRKEGRRKERKGRNKVKTRDNKKEGRK
jgi:hypothetical protein